MAVDEASLSPLPTRSVFGLFSVPTRVYPWVLMLVLQFLLPNVSFVGHLAGILVGFAHTYGALSWAIPSLATIRKLEQSPWMQRIVRVGPYKLAPAGEVLRESVTLRQSWEQASGWACHVLRPLTDCVQRLTGRATSAATAAAAAPSRFVSGSGQLSAGGATAPAAARPGSGGSGGSGSGSAFAGGGLGHSPSALVDDVEVAVIDTSPVMPASGGVTSAAAAAAAADARSKAAAAAMGRAAQQARQKPTGTSPLADAAATAPAASASASAPDSLDAAMDAVVAGAGGIVHVPAGSGGRGTSSAAASALERMQGILGGGRHQHHAHVPLQEEADGEGDESEQTAGPRRV